MERIDAEVILAILDVKPAITEELAEDTGYPMIAVQSELDRLERDGEVVEEGGVYHPASLICVDTRLEDKARVREALGEGSLSAWQIEEKTKLTPPYRNEILTEMLKDGDIAWRNGFYTVAAKKQHTGTVSDKILALLDGAEVRLSSTALFEALYPGEKLTKKKRLALREYIKPLIQSGKVKKDGQSHYWLTDKPLPSPARVQMLKEHAQRNGKAFTPVPTPPKPAPEPAVVKGPDAALAALEEALSHRHRHVIERLDVKLATLTKLSTILDESIAEVLTEIKGDLENVSR